MAGALFSGSGTAAASTTAASATAGGSVAGVSDSAEISGTSITDGGTERTDTSEPAAISALPTVPVIPVLNRPVRIIVVGDSTAQATGGGLVQWAALHPDLAKVWLFAAPGCGFVRGGVVPTDGAEPFKANCDHALDHDLPDALQTLHPDVVMLMTTIRDIEPRIFDNAEGPITPKDARYVARARTSYDAITNLVLASSPTVHVAWVRPPAINPYWLDLVTPSRDPDAHEAIERVMREEAATHPDRVAVLDLGTWLEDAGLDQNHDYRPDGLHFGPQGALEVAEWWLGPELIIEATRATGG